MAKDSIVKVRDLLIEYGHGKNKVSAVKEVSFDIYKGETFGLVGESGSGKSTIGKALMGIEPINDGTIYYQDTLAFGKAPNLIKMNEKMEHHIKVMKLNQTAITKALEIYSEEYKRVYFKYIEGRYYDLKSKETVEYSDNKIRKIEEGLDLKDHKLVSKSKDPKLKLVEDAVREIIKRILKLYKLQDKSLAFLKMLKEDGIINPELLKKVNELHSKTNKLTVKIRKSESKMYLTIQEIEKVRNDVRKGKYKSVKRFFFDLGKLLEVLIAEHKLVSSMISDLKQAQKLSSAIVSTGRDKKQWLKWIDEKIATIDDKSKVAEFELIKELMSIESIQKTLEKSPKYSLPTSSERHELKKQMQMIFQDPASSLNDRMPVEEIIAEGLDNFPELYKNEQAAQTYIDWFNSNNPDKVGKITLENIRYQKVKQFLILQLLTTVGMLPEHLSRYPHEFSGGQRQRIGIARALVMKPSFVVCDEPISALDVSIRAQVINLLAKFQLEFDLTYIFIAHDLSVVRFIANRIAVIYRGDIVELADADELFNNPLHPYTKSLLSAVPLPDPDLEKKKKSIKYKPEEQHFDYITDSPKWIEVQKGHFILANEREVSEIKSEKRKIKKIEKGA
ncbi:ATP-binding cassette domain-containing protein [Mesoplasma florum]|uniref:Oligopeptide transport ATP-binding protein OppF n=1 Tax=Mesoplasma florum TaxID=2151 RepID=A0AAD2JE41_MESFO|nr:ATP-binding cassette domain-containing protein [Mesoplasma florum]AVN65509.1 Oligopeptide transport ATP-binding protein OppF [Mesoplasma florum]